MGFWMVLRAAEKSIQKTFWNLPSVKFIFNPDLYSHLHFPFASSLPPFLPHRFFLSIKSDITHVCEIKAAAVPEGMRSERGTACQLQLLTYTYRCSFPTHLRWAGQCAYVQLHPASWNQSIFIIIASPDSKMLLAPARECCTTKEMGAPIQVLSLA